MTTAELIEILKKYPADTPVMLRGYEGGWDDVRKERIYTSAVLLNCHEATHMGQHEEFDLLTQDQKTKFANNEIVQAITIERASY